MKASIGPTQLIITQLLT